MTGTQGKTTTTRLLENGLLRAGVPSAVVGTIGTRILGQDVKTALTTPEAPDLHGLFALMVERGVDVCAMEVSSHALVMGRVDGVVFDVAVFTNLGRDHLDFHADETGDASATALRAIAEARLRHRFEGSVVVGHCCSLAVQSDSEVDRTLDLVAKARLDIVSLPMCNLFLQDRVPGRTPRWRGVTLLHEMQKRDAKKGLATLCIGGGMGIAMCIARD